MAKELIIIGAGGDGINVAEVIIEMNGYWNLLGFLDDDPNKQGMEICGVPILGTIDDINKYEKCYISLLVGNPKRYFIKKRLVSNLGIDKNRYATIIHPSAWVSKSAQIGRGSVILPMATVMSNANIGDHVFIASKTNIGHDTQIKDYVTISAMAAIAGNVQIEEGCYVGLNSCVRERIKVGKWSLVGMGSVVISNVPAYHVVVGNPAKTLRVLKPTNFAL